jgi:ATP-dependent DNA ligase
MHCAILLCFPEGDKLVPPRRQALMLATSGGDILPLALAALERRKVALARLLARAGYGVQLNEHLEAEGPLVFEHASRMGLEGIVSKRKTSRLRCGTPKASARGASG